MNYEYGIRWHAQRDFEPPHRWGMTKKEAYKWIKDGMPVGYFNVIRRKLGEWEKA